MSEAEIYLLLSRYLYFYVINQNGNMIQLPRGTYLLQIHEVFNTNNT